jgi:hypothetical protein
LGGASEVGRLPNQARVAWYKTQTAIPSLDLLVWMMRLIYGHLQLSS